MSDAKLADPLLTLPGYSLRRAANAMMSDLAGRLAAVDMRISDSSVLLLIAGRRDMTSSEIGKSLEIQRANMVPLLKRLETAGLIDRVPLDGKSQAIVLTGLGEERLAQVQDITDQFEQDLMAKITPEHRGSFIAALQALIV